MTKLTFDISMSLDGYVAGPDADLEEPLGRGGEQLHEWIFGLRSWREPHDLEGGETGPDDEVVSEWQSRSGATIMGRRMFSGGQGPWARDPKANGWWGDDPPFHHPVFVLTSHPREPLPLKGGTTFTFVTGGPEAALGQARAAAGEKDVAVAGGANVGQQYLQAGLLDELPIHVVPVLLGGGVRLLDHIDPGRVTLQPTRVIGSPAVTHLRYRLN
jgi:dihydrofolate reductase